jgi:hypothetical protein
LSAQQPKGGAVPTGEPLAVVDDLKVWTTKHSEKVAEAKYKDETGKTIATAALYEDRTQVHTKKIWFPVQGAAQLRDEDFFRIAGDEEALTATEELRARGRSWQKTGYITMGAGIAVAIIGYLIPNLTAKYVVASAGGLTAGAGYWIARQGAQDLDPENHAVDRSVAERAANTYNQKIGTTVGVGVGGEF